MRNARRAISGGGAVEAGGSGRGAQQNGGQCRRDERTELHPRRLRTKGGDALPFPGYRRARRAIPALRLIEAVTDAPDASDLQGRSDLTDLLPESGDVDIHDARRHARGVVPDMLENLRPGKKPSLGLG